MALSILLEHRIEAVEADMIVKENFPLDKPVNLIELKNKKYTVPLPLVDFIQGKRQHDSTSVGSFYISVKL